MEHETALIDAYAQLNDYTVDHMWFAVIIIGILAIFGATIILVPLWLEYKVVTMQRSHGKPQRNTRRITVRRVLVYLVVTTFAGILVEVILGLPITSWLFGGGG